MNQTHWKRNVTLFIIGQGITLFGSMLVHYAVMWHITLQTQSGIMMTLLAAAGTLPMFFLSPFAGVWADRYNKKNLINLADGVIALVTLLMAGLFSQGVDSIALLLLCLVLRAFGQSIQTPSVNALIPELVPPEHLTRVNSLSSGLQSFVMFASPMAGGALLATAPIHILMLLDVVTATIGIVILFFFVKVPARSQSEKLPQKGVQAFTDIKEGLRYIRKNAFLRKAILLTALFNIMIAPVAVMTPLQVARNYGDDIWLILNGFPFGPPQRLAAVEVVFFVGMMIGALVLALWGGFRNKSHTMALSTFFLGAGCMGLGVLSNFWGYLLCTGFIGIVMNLFNPPMMATMQINIDSTYMGRVFSVLSMIGGVMMPLGMVLWGPLGDIVDIGWLLLASGAVVFLMGFIFLWDKSMLQAGEATLPGLAEE